jgi:RHS repeat-associated protein
VAEYRYNALNHRIGVHEDSDTDGDVDSNDKWYYDAFDERWRMLARFRESDTAPKEDFVPHQAGDSGHGTSSYIDLVICRNRDADTAWTAASDGTLEERSYLLQNWRADVSAVVSGSGLLKEWVKYSSYGIPIGLPGGDTDSDGDCDASDITQVQTWITASAYDVRGDVDLDGDVDASDKSELQTNYQGITLGRGVLSSNAVASRKGYAGYEGLTNLAGSLWLARNRVLMAELGRWGRRDPLGYVNGATLFAYTGSSPASRLDPLGLDFTGAIGGGNVHNSTTQEIYVYGESDAWLFPDHLQGWLAPGQWSGDNGWGDADNVEVKCPIPCAVAWVTIPGGTNCTVKCDPCCTVICERHLIPFVPRTALVLYQ